MSLLLSKATEKDLANLQKIAEKGDDLIEMRNKQGILLAVGTSIKALNEEKSKEGQPLYRVDIKKVLDYDHVKEIITYDIQLDIYQGKKEIEFNNPKTQDFFNKQETYWLFCAKKWYNSSSNLLKDSDCIINRLKY